METIVNNILNTFDGFWIVVVVWVATQIVAKVAIRSWQEGRLYLHVVVEDGGMPSSHCALRAAVFMYTVLICALDSEPTAQDLLSVALAATAAGLLITNNDALKRKSNGDNSEATNQLIEERNTKFVPNVAMKLVKVVRGHTKPEVLVGDAIGAAISAVMYLTLFA
jgi:acid phosphatase family membrane protein YuiD